MKARIYKKVQRRKVMNALLRNGWIPVAHRKHVGTPDVRTSGWAPCWLDFPAKRGHSCYLLESAEGSLCAVLEVGTGLQQNGKTTLWLATTNYSPFCNQLGEYNGTLDFGTDCWTYQNPFKLKATVKEEGCFDDDPDKPWAIEPLDIA